MCYKKLISDKNRRMVRDTHMYGWDKIEMGSSETVQLPEKHKEKIILNSSPSISCVSQTFLSISGWVEVIGNVKGGGSADGEINFDEESMEYSSGVG